MSLRERETPYILYKKDGDIRLCVTQDSIGLIEIPIAYSSLCEVEVFSYPVSQTCLIVVKDRSHIGNNTKAYDHILDSKERIERVLIDMENGELQRIAASRKKYTTDILDSMMYSVCVKGEFPEKKIYTTDIKGMHWGVKKDHSYTPNIKNVEFNDPLTVVIWEDGTKTFVKCGEGDVYDPEKGLAMAIAKKALGNKYKSLDIIDEWIEKKSHGKTENK